MPGQALSPTFQKAAPAYSVATPRRRVMEPLRGLAFMGAIVILTLLAADWIAGLALIVLIVGLRILARENGPPVLAAAFASQWLQVTVAIFYFAVTGRQVIEMTSANYRPMVLIGLACVVTLFTGIYLGAGIRRRPAMAGTGPSQLPWSARRIAVAYVVAVSLFGALQTIAWMLPGLTQAILVVSRIRYVLLFILVGRLVTGKPQWG